MEEKQEIITQIAEMTAGEMLRNARTTGRRKREIATIAKLLCIKEEFLTALEEGNYRVIPEDVYILGFARSYAVELGLNPDDVIAQLKRELGLTKEDKREDKKEEKKDEEPEKTPVVSKNQNQSKISKEYIVNLIKTSVNYVKKHWVWFLSGFCVLLVTAILLIVLLPGKSNVGELNAEQVITENIAENAEIAVFDPDFRYPVREKFDIKNRKESRVVLQAEKESWVKIEDARGGTVFSRVLVPGDVYYMPLGDKFKGTFGNAGAIDVWVDGHLLNKVGPANTRKNGISMAPDALKALGFAE